MAHIGWLHLSDLRVGAESSRLFDNELREELDRDLRRLHLESGPWDAVILTGDLTDVGSHHEFGTVDLFLDSLLRDLAELGSHPVVLAVPGGHDAKLSRAEPDFEAFLQWAKRRTKGWRAEAPGNVSYTLSRGDARLQVLGFNSAKEKTKTGEWRGRLSINLGIALRAVMQEGVPWLVLTHHPTWWLQASHRSPLDKVTSKRPALHLCGHARQGDAPAPGEAPSAPLFQALSLLGKPPFGYAAGRADFDGRRFQIWPRAFAEAADGRMVVGADWSLKRLDADESFSVSWPEGVAVPARRRDVEFESHALPREAPAPPPAAPPKAALESLEPVVALPAGISLHRSISGGEGRVIWPAWSPDGERIATGDANGSVRVLDVETGHSIWISPGDSYTVADVAWSPDGQRLAAISEWDLRIWDAARGGEPSLVRGDFPLGGYGLAFRPKDGSLVFRSLDQHVRRLDPAEGKVTDLKLGPASAVAWSPNGSRLAVANALDGEIELWAPDNAFGSPTLASSGGSILDLAWMRARSVLAIACADGSIVIWDLASKEAPRATLAAHSDAVTSVSFSHDDRLLATKSHDGTVKLWRTDTWDNVASIPEGADRHYYGGLAFSPVAPRLVTLESWNVRIWNLDIDALLRTAAPKTVHSVSAKIVLVGEGSAGKTCLALRLAEDRYEELGSTHGMRFWPMAAERLDPEARAPAGEEREAVLWDLGGQSEYRLVHQLFLADTAVALLVMEPRRGQAALDEIEGWLLRLEKHHVARPMKKLLVGTKLDDARAPEDRAAIDRFVKEHKLDGYIGTSARSGDGILALRRAIAQAVSWDEIGKTSQLELFRGIRREIEAQIAARRVVLPLSELDQILKARDPATHDPEAVRAVVRQLARQGVLADTRLADGTRALVLQVEQLERYAGSLIVMARENPRGIAAVDLASVMSPSVKLPRFREGERLRRDQELSVLDCVVEMLLEHGLALRHEGLLVFPSLFQPTEHDEAFSHTIALFYELSGPVDNIYASLVTALAMSRQFGALRLWEDRAELARAGEGTAGIRRVQRGGHGARGIARIELYFDEAASDGKRELFVAFVEEHLREHGVEILESLTMTCACGVELPEKAVRNRIDKGFADIVCPGCETRYPLTFGAGEAKEKSPDLHLRLRALKTTIADERRRTVSETKVNLSRIQRAQASMAPEPPIRILHLSDLHVSADADPVALLQPLSADLEDRRGGLGIDKLDVLVVSGDVTNRASAAEFEKARELVSGIIAKFGLTAERCVLVPGNHDLDWNEEVYRTVKKRSVDPVDLVPGRFKAQGDLYEIRDDARYNNRFKNFSQYYHHPLLQRAYPLSPEQQGISILCDELGIQFLSLNSAWEIDEYFPSRSGVHPGALARGIEAADQEVDRARREGRIARGGKVLRIGVWHHPVTGNEKIEEDAFVGGLQKAGVRLCLHGHVHEERADLVGYLDPKRSLHVAGAGSFGAPGKERPESVPRLYNVVEIERDLSRARVYTRCLRKPTGAWEGWAVWPGRAANEKRDYYEVDLG